MASEITHLVFANTLYEKYFSDKKREDFLIGACLPDIRYIDNNLDRQSTHFDIREINQVIREKDGLAAGIKFHSLTDYKRKQFLGLRGGIIIGFDPRLFDWWGYKLLEDEILYDNFNNWTDTTTLLKEYWFKILPFSISMTKYNKYLNILGKYFCQKPNENSRRLFLSALGYADSAISEEENTIIALKTNQEVIATIEEMYEKIEEIILN